MTQNLYFADSGSLMYDVFVALDWRVGQKRSSNFLSRMSVPSCIVEMKVIIQLYPILRLGELELFIHSVFESCVSVKYPPSLGNACAHSYKSLMTLSRYRSSLQSRGSCLESKMCNLSSPRRSRAKMCYFFPVFMIIILMICGSISS